MIVAVLRSLWQRHVEHQRYRALIAEIERLTSATSSPVRQLR